MKRALIAGLFYLLAFHTVAATTATEAIDERAQGLGGAYHALSVAFAEIFQKSGGFMTGAFGFTPPAARKKWGFNAGLAAGSTRTPIDKGLTTRNQQATYQPYVATVVNSLPDPLAIPQTGFNAHLGLPTFFVFESFDVGLRYNGINMGDSAFNLDFSNVGLDLRGNIHEQGPKSPVTLMLGLGLDSFKGGLHLKSVAPASDTSFVSGYNATGIMTSGFDEVLDNNALSLKVVVSRKMKFFVPYAGVSAQVNSGNSSMTQYSRGTITMTNSSFPVDTDTSSKAVEGSAKTPIGSLEFRAGLGAELDFKFAYLQVNTEYGTVSEGFGANIQVGGKFR